MGREEWGLEGLSNWAFAFGTARPQNELEGVLASFRGFDFNQVVRERRSVAKIGKDA
jgi:hypothetical protein